jgi:chromosomal replication initiation ATPase DnaA
VDAIDTRPWRSSVDVHHVADSPGVGKTHLAIALGRAVVEAGHSVLCTSATALLAALAKAETEGQLADRLLFYSKPKLLIIDELGYLPFERRSAHLFFQLVARRYERGSLLLTTNQVVTQWGTVFGDEVLAARDSRSPAAPQPHADDPRRELSTVTEEEGRLAREDTAIPHVTTVVTRSLVLMAYSVGARRPRPARAVRKNTNEEGSVLMSEGGQFLLSLDKWVDDGQD